MAKEAVEGQGRETVHAPATPRRMEGGRARNLDLKVRLVKPLKPEGRLPRMIRRNHRNAELARAAIARRIAQRRSEGYRKRPMNRLPKWLERGRAMFPVWVAPVGAEVGGASSSASS